MVYQLSPFNTAAEMEKDEDKANQGQNLFFLVSYFFLPVKVRLYKHDNSLTNGLLS